jgi:DNA repair exonuclease SbcCD ATPase subunit
MISSAAWLVQPVRLQIAQQDLDLGTLSTGERARVGLALALGYVQLLAERGVAAADTLILDEVHAHLDNEGVRRVIEVLRGLRQRTVLLVAQEGSVVVDGADHHVTVVKRRDGDVVVECQF